MLAAKACVGVVLFRLHQVAGLPPQKPLSFSQATREVMVLHIQWFMPNVAVTAAERTGGSFVLLVGRVVNGHRRQTGRPRFGQGLYGPQQPGLGALGQHPARKKRTPEGCGVVQRTPKRCGGRQARFIPLP